MKGDELAFPCERSLFYQGLTKREWLIGMAMQGILSKTTEVYNDVGTAMMAIACADAVLAALEKEQPSPAIATE